MNFLWFIAMLCMAAVGFVDSQHGSNDLALFEQQQQQQPQHQQLQQQQHHHMLMQPSKRHGHKYSRKFCGPELNKALRNLCQSVYAESDLEKRGGTALVDYASPMWFDEFDDGDDSGYDNNAALDGFLFDDSSPQTASWPFLTRQSARALLAGAAADRHRRYRRGVYDECCTKPCTENELRAYCGPQG